MRTRSPNHQWTEALLSQLLHASPHVFTNRPSSQRNLTKEGRQIGVPIGGISAASSMFAG